MGNKNLFLKINVLSLGSVLVLILVGSIVRSTGAGMGCPDWPKCFGSYVPPTSADQLPENYLELFKAKRIAKNNRLAKLFDRFGYESLAQKISNDPAILEEQEFSVTKAWIEYINRLVGVLIGFLVFLNMIFAFSIRDKKWIWYMGILIFLLTGFQGWVGSLVVSTNLLKGFITFHMILALVIVALLIWMNVRARELEAIPNRKVFILSLITFLLFLPQIILGTEVRHSVDGLLISDVSRVEWVQNLTETFVVHRSYSWLVLIGSSAIFVLIRRLQIIELIGEARMLLSLVVATALVGVIMSNFGFPFWAQPLHLLFATGIFSVLFYLILRLKIA